VIVAGDAGTALRDSAPQAKADSVGVGLQRKGSFAERALSMGPRLRGNDVLLIHRPGAGQYPPPFCLAYTCAMRLSPIIPSAALFLIRASNSVAATGRLNR
jgi:hypothetical protein